MQWSNVKCSHFPHHKHYYTKILYVFMQLKLNKNCIFTIKMWVLTFISAIFFFFIFFVWICFLHLQNFCLAFDCFLKFPIFSSNFCFVFFCKFWIFTSPILWTQFYGCHFFSQNNNNKLKPQTERKTQILPK